MGTAGGSGADPGRGTHSRSELTTPHLSHLAQALNVQQLLKKENLAFFGRFWPSGLAEAARTAPGGAPDGPDVPARTRASYTYWRALIAQ